MGVVELEDDPAEGRGEETQVRPVRALERCRQPEAAPERRTNNRPERLRCVVVRLVRDEQRPLGGVVRRERTGCGLNGRDDHVGVVAEQGSAGTPTFDRDPDPGQVVEERLLPLPEERCRWDEHEALHAVGRGIADRDDPDECLPRTRDGLDDAAVIGLGPVRQRSGLPVARLRRPVGEHTRSGHHLKALRLQCPGGAVTVR